MRVNERHFTLGNFVRATSERDTRLVPAHFTRAPRGNRNRERGQAALFATMTLGVTLGLTGLVVDQGWAYWRQEACLTAAQAAAIGGSIYANNANSTWPPASCTTSTAVSCNSNGTTCPSTLTLNSTATSVLQAACLYAQQNGFKATGDRM